MKLFIALLLIGNYCFAQKNFVVLDEKNSPISGVSIFLIGKTNELIAVSDDRGKINIRLLMDSRYLVHSLGYEEAEFTTNQLDEISSIKLKESSFKLNEVKIGLSLKTLTLKKPINPRYNTVIDLPQHANIQRVNSIRIDTPGYLKNFKLFCKIQVKEVVSDYRFILFTEKDGKPDSLLIPLRIEGKRSRKEIVFGLSKANYFLEKGTYFIGYETFNGKAIIKKQIHTDKKMGQMIEVALVIFCSDERKISFSRSNLSNWFGVKYGEMVDGKMVWKDNLDKNFAYELEMLY